MGVAPAIAVRVDNGCPATMQKKMAAVFWCHTWSMCVLYIGYIFGSSVFVFFCCGRVFTVCGFVSCLYGFFLTFGISMVLLLRMCLSFLCMSNWHVVNIVQLYHQFATLSVWN